MSESGNLVGLQTDKARELCEMLTAYLKSVGAQTPIDRETHRPVAFPHIESLQTENL